MEKNMQLMYDNVFRISDNTKEYDDRNYFEWKKIDFHIFILRI